MAEAGNSTGALTTAPHEDRLASQGSRSKPVLDRAVPVCHGNHSTATTQTCPKLRASHQAKDLTTKVTTRGRMGRAGGPFPVALPVVEDARVSGTLGGAHPSFPFYRWANKGLALGQVTSGLKLLVLCHLIHTEQPWRAQPCPQSPRCSDHITRVCIK